MEVTIHKDDLNGKILTEGDEVNLPFQLDGVSYAIDLTRGNAKKLRDALKVYVEAGRKATVHTEATRSRPTGRPRLAPMPSFGSTKQATRTGIDREQARVIREWAATQPDLPQIKPSGRIPAVVLAAWQARKAVPTPTTRDEDSAPEVAFSGSEATAQ